MPHLLQQEGFGGLSPLRLLEGDRQPLFGQPDVLPLDAAQAPTIASPADIAPEERGSAFRDFATRIASPNSLLFKLSGAFGQGTEEIAERKRRAVADRFNLARTQAAEAALTAQPKRQIIKDVGGFLRFADTGERVFPEAQAAQKAPSAFRERVNALVSTGVDENTAIGIAAGRLVTSRDPITNEAVVVDKAGRVVNRLPADVGVQQPSPVSPQAQQPAQPQPDVTEALGASGFAKSTVNTVADLFGSDLPFADAERAAANLDNLNLRTVALASGGIEGRPNVFFQEKVNRLLPQPGEIFTGAGKSITRFRALSQSFNEEADNIENLIKTKKVRPATLDDAQRRVNELRSLAGQYDQFIQSAQPRDLPPLESFFK